MSLEADILHTNTKSKSSTQASYHNLADLMLGESYSLELSESTNQT